MIDLTTHAHGATGVPRLCRCGCGTPLRSDTSEFAPGHHMRLAVRTSKGGAAGPVRERLPCACGCGTRVKDRHAKYLPGHQPKEWLEAQFGPGNVRVCVECRAEFRVPPAHDHRRVTCGKPICL